MASNSNVATQPARLHSQDHLVLRRKSDQPESEDNLSSTFVTPQQQKEGSNVNAMGAAIS